MLLRSLVSFRSTLPLICSLLLFPSTSMKPAALSIDADMNLRDYVMAEGAVEGTLVKSEGVVKPSNTLLEIPGLYLYSPRGELLYHGNSKTRPQTQILLDGLPDSGKALAPVKGAATLESMLAIVPEFKKKSRDLLSDGNYVVYAVTRKEAVPTTTQKAIFSLRARGGDLPVDTLLIRLEP